MRIDRDALDRTLREDRELQAGLGRLSARVRIGPADQPVEIEIADGKVRGIVPGIAPGGAPADLVIAAPDEFWRDTLVPTPAYAAGSLTAGGAALQGDLHRIVAPYYAAWERLLVLLRQVACGAGKVHPAAPLRRDTDDAVGRYVHVGNASQEARLYYEEAGQGTIPLLLQATAGADARQWRHMLAYPELRRRFRMIAYDLPCHGKSLPPVGEPWWEDGWHPTRDQLMGWAVGLVRQLRLDRPVFLGCSVGGQLAIDLAAWHPDSFRAFVSLNGWARPSAGMQAFDNAPFRDPAVSTEYYTGRVLATTSPIAPEASRHETCWIYRSNAPGIYAGDNDYFMQAHDFGTGGRRIDTARTPLFALAGEYDRSASSPDHGAPALPRHVPGAVYRLLPGLGHFAPSDDPEAFCAAITPILDEVIAACPPGGAATTPAGSYA